MTLKGEYETKRKRSKTTDARIMFSRIKMKWRALNRKDSE